MSHMRLVAPAQMRRTANTYYSTIDQKMLTPPSIHASVPQQIIDSLVGLAAFPEGTVIYEGLKDNGELGFDQRKEYLGWIRRKMRMQSLRTKGYLDSSAQIVHTTTDQEIIDTTRRETPLLELIPQETARGRYANYDVLTARGSAYGGGESMVAQVPASDTYGNSQKLIWISTAWGGWTDYGLAVMASQYPTRDARAIEIRNKTWSENETNENEIINGSMAGEAAFNPGYPAAGGSGAPDTFTGYIGLRGEIYSSTGSSYSASINVSMTGADVADTDIDSIIAAGTQQNVKYNLMVTDLQTWQKLKQLMMSLVRYMNPETEIAWGLKALAWATPYGVAPIIGSKFMPTTAGQREILFLDTKFLAQRLLLDSTMQMLAKVSIQQPFVINRFFNSIDKTDAAVQTYTYNTTPSGTSGTSKMGRLYLIA